MPKLFKNKSLLILVAILLLAFALRFYRLNSVPALNADEAAIGYNVLSLIETGRDEHGNLWPIHFQSFNDFKPGLYFYIVLPFVRFMDLTAAVRAPAAALAVGTVFLVYLLVKELFDDERLALVASLFLALSPWHIHFSRGGWEVSVATFFVVLGVWLFVRAQRIPKYFIPALLSFVLSMYAYHAARVVVPLLGLSLLVVYKKEVLKNSKSFLLAGVIAFALLLPLGFDFLNSNAASRAAGVGLFADRGPIARINEQRGEHGGFGGPMAILLHNKPVNFGLAFLENWGEHFWGEFLFLSGDEIERNRVPETGQMYTFDAVLIGFGFLGIVYAKSKNRKSWAVVISWLVIAPVGAALTFQSPHALRAQNMVVPLVIISAFGLVSFLAWMRRKVSRKILMISKLIVLVIITLSVMRYLHMYWVHMAKEYPFSSQYGLRELAEFIETKGDKYKKIVITDRYDQPYILLLYYLKYSPLQFQGEHTLTAPDQFGFSTVRKFGRFEFRSIKFEEEKLSSPNSLIIGTDEEIPPEANIIKKIYGSNGTLYFEIVEN